MELELQKRCGTMAADIETTSYSDSVKRVVKLFAKETRQILQDIDDAMEVVRLTKSAEHMTRLEALVEDLQHRTMAHEDDSRRIERLLRRGGVSKLCCILLALILS